MTKKTEKKIGFSEAYGELEQIVAWFEGNEVDLEESLDKFERGLALAQTCKDRLAVVENRVREIKAKFEGKEGEGGDVNGDGEVEIDKLF